jgi:hypothetical protein
LRSWSSTASSPKTNSTGITSDSVSGLEFSDRLLFERPGDGANSATITPTIAYGKGFGNFDAQGIFGVQIPTNNELANGRNYVWNNTLQYRVVKKIWPEIEFNTTHYQDGEHAGKTLNYITPGIVAGRFKLMKRVSMSIGGGLQITTTQFYRNNYNGILTVRFPF